MANKYKMYFLSPEHDPRALGSEVHKSVKEHFMDTIDQSKTNKFGLWAQFLQIFGLEAEANVSFDKGTIEKYSFKRMRTEFFLPSKEFAKAAVKIAEVADFLEQTDYQEPVYIITGIKTVEGASVITVQKKGRGFHLKAGFDGTPAGVPITIGPEANHKNSESKRASFKNSSPVVFAYELSEMWQKRDSKAVTLKSHTKGALFGLYGTEVDLETEIVEGLSKLDDGSDVVPAFDEDREEPCNCVLPLAVPRSP